MTDVTMNDAEHGAMSDLRAEIWRLDTGQSHETLIDQLGRMLSPFGDLAGISHLETCRDRKVFLVDFAQDRAAIAAANATGMRLFGFRTLIIDLRPAAS